MSLRWVPVITKLAQLPHLRQCYYLPQRLLLNNYKHTHSFNCITHRYFSSSPTKGEVRLLVKRFHRFFYE